ncbi:MAG TPA: hypothetical protein PLP07_11000 [Pyrinomonadaceae bacterium]|nr:hypothetical protein [Pyrinomonadaceae bacterium]
MVEENRRSYRHIIYAVISVACPFIAFGLISLYQEYAHEWFWEVQKKPWPLDDADKNAVVMGAIAMAVEAALAVVVGLIVGTMFAALSLKRKLRFISFGTAALLFNLIPLIPAIALFLWSRNGI